jgi:hypothetical protein
LVDTAPGRFLTVFHAGEAKAVCLARCYPEIAALLLFAASTFSWSKSMLTLDRQMTVLQASLD